MQYALLNGARLRVLLTRPDTRAYGNAILNMAWSFHMARALDAALFVDPLDGSRLDALTALECEGVRRSGLSRRMGPVLRWAWGQGRRVGLCAVGTLHELGPGGRGTEAERAYFGLDLRRVCAATPLRVRLPGPVEDRVARQAARLGLADRRLVTLHVREAGHKAALGVTDRDKDTARNAEIGTYGEAIDWLVARGYVVVRIGGPEMTPLSRPGVVDLATHPERSLALELWCVFRSAFLMAGDSGPFNLSVLTGVPCLGTNMTHLIGAYPLRCHDRMLLKPVREAEEGTMLSLSDMLTASHMKHRWVPGRFLFEDNSPEQIRDAAVEMVRILDAPEAAPTPAQRSAREAVLTFLASDYGRRKQKGQSFFLGDGFIVDHSLPDLHVPAS